MAAQTEWLEKDYYKVLGVSEEASEAEIARAYRSLARKWHPDANPGSKAEAEERFKEISAAYDVIGDKDKRAEYDQLRRLGPAMSGGGSTGSGPFRVRVGNFDDFDDFADGGDIDLGGFGFDDLLGGVFGRSSRPGRPGPGRSRRGGDLQAVVELSFEDAVRGATTTVALVADEPCGTCSGSGAAPGASVKVCSACAGSGVVASDQGFVSLRQTCPACGGAGSAPVRACADCYGSGRQRRRRQVKVRVPSGVEDGDRIRVRGRGAPGAAGGPPGDLYVIVRVGAHPIFGRAGSNLTVTVPISVTEAALGTELKVPTLEGDPVTLKVPAGTQPGQVLRVRGRGVPASGRRRGGDLLVSLHVVVPKGLSHKQRKAFEALAAVLPPPAREHLGI